MPGAYCTFRVGDLLVGVDVDCVQEVLYDPEVTPVPLAHPSVVGLVNLRGQIVAAVDARRRLGLAEREPEASSAHVIVRSRSEVVSLVVDADDEVVDVDMDAFDEAPESMNAAVRDLITGIHQLDIGLLLLLDADRALSVADR